MYFATQIQRLVPFATLQKMRCCNVRVENRIIILMNSCHVVFNNSRITESVQV